MSRAIPGVPLSSTNARELWIPVVLAVRGDKRPDTQIGPRRPEKNEHRPEPDSKCLNRATGRARTYQRGVISERTVYRALPICGRPIHRAALTSVAPPLALRSSR